MFAIIQNIFSFTDKKYSCVHLRFMLVELTLKTWNTHTVGVSAVVLIRYLDMYLQLLPFDALCLNTMHMSQ